MQPPQISAKYEAAAIVRRFRDLVRIPSADESDPLI